MGFELLDNFRPVVARQPPLEADRGAELRPDHEQPDASEKSGIDLIRQELERFPEARPAGQQLQHPHQHDGQR